MNHSIGLLAIAGLLMTGCTHVDAEDARKNLETSQTRVDEQVLSLAKKLSESFGRSPKITQRIYRVCGSAPVDALEYNAIAEFVPKGGLTVDAVRQQIIALGWEVTGSNPAQGVSPEILFVKRGDLSSDVGVKPGEISVMATGECIRVTDEQANKLEPASR